MKINTRRSFFGVIAAMTSFVIGAMKLSAQQTPSGCAQARQRTRGWRYDPSLGPR